MLMLCSTAHASVALQSTPCRADLALNISGPQRLFNESQRNIATLFLSASLSRTLRMVRNVFPVGGPAVLMITLSPSHQQRQSLVTGALPVVHAGSGPDGADGEEGKGEGRQRPDGHSVSTPLHDLPEEVRPRHKLKHAP